MSTAKEFVEFWLKNSVHADEQFSVRRGRPEIDELVRRLLTAAKDQGFAQEQIEAQLGGDIYDYIRSSIDSQNAQETSRLKRDP
ncbi:hypothetical protein [Streptomyces sp. Alain-F2R5]|uniref:hypothetical protein n=1 Tax=uncultured Bradyrhizobium sp. TaxID=199684 RepID=UPI00117EB3E5|nr:hypothetical protein [Streptomyces sp. Alain-F2R5]